MSVAILAQAQIAKMSHLHDLPGYVTTEVPIESLQTTMSFSLLFGACAAIKDFRGSDQDHEDAHLVTLCYHRNVREPIVSIVCGFLGIRPPEACNLISGQGGWSTTSLTRILTNMMNDAWKVHVRDWAAFEGAISYQHHSSEDGRIFMVGMDSCPGPVLETVDTLHLC